MNSEKLLVLVAVMPVVMLSIHLAITYYQNKKKSQ